MALDSDDKRDEVAGELVSVIVPAYNAGRYIDRTLLSVRGQTHGNLEILVVDDGSSDETPDIALRHAGMDPRIRLIRQDNAGVAAARNSGIAHARGRYVAPIDADDLWAPDKIERQMAAIHGATVPIGLVYSWYALIGEQDEIIDAIDNTPEDGEFLQRMCRYNVVGNGSSALLLRQAVLDVGGYDTSLRERNAQGCEDYKLYFLIAERFAVTAVKDYLTGYRVHAESMSAQADQMIRSRRIVTGEIMARRPTLTAELQRGNVRVMRFLLARCLRTKDFDRARGVVRDMFALDRAASMKELGLLMLRGARTGLRAARRRLGLATRQRFLDDKH
ncbi:MAG: glycosyltransferase family 2 protein [Chelatococcus sp.]|nr:MAG: glycosyltransferase family 2 protein [Chelatococcus sp.]